MQRIDFSNGGFVLHRIDETPTSRYSAWYDTEGNLIDAELVMQRSTRGVKRGSKQWDYLQKRGHSEAKRGTRS